MKFDVALILFLEQLKVVCVQASMDLNLHSKTIITTIFCYVTVDIYGL